MDMDPNDIPRGGPWDRHANPASPPSRLGRRDQSQRREDVRQRRVAGSKPLAGLGFPVFPHSSVLHEMRVKALQSLLMGGSRRSQVGPGPPRSAVVVVTRGHEQLGQGTWLHAGPLCPL